MDMTNVRIALPETVQANEVIQIKTLITHPMETGYRRDGMGQPIPRNILTHFECRFEGQPVFTAQLHTGIAANPYLAFHARVPHSGSFEFIWSGDNDFIHRAVRQVAVRTD